MLHREIFKFRLSQMSSPELSGHCLVYFRMWFSLILYSYCSRHAITFIGPILYSPASEMSRSELERCLEPINPVVVSSESTEPVVSIKLIVSGDGK